MKITIYKLIEMIKDDKASDITTDFIFNEKKYNLISFLDEYALDINSLNWEIEILEEKKIPEKLGSCAYVEGEIGYSWSKSEALLKTKINEIIDYLKSKGE